MTPLRDGITIWGLTTEDTASVNWKFAFEIDGKPIAVELFRHTTKILPITGQRLDAVKELANLDKAITWALAWGDRREAIAAEAAAAAPAATPKPASAPKKSAKSELKPAADVSAKPAPDLRPNPQRHPIPRLQATATASTMRCRHNPRSSLTWAEITTIDLAELVDERVPKNRKIRCPFHAETRPACTSIPTIFIATAAMPMATTSTG